MKKALARYKRHYIRCLQIIDNNQEEIKKDNQQVLAEIFFVAILISVPLFFITMVLEPERCLYVAFGSISLVSYILLTNLDRILQRVPIVLLEYMILLLIYVVAVYIGIITNQANYAVVLPVFFALVPTLFIVKPKKILAFFLLIYAWSVIMILTFKGVTPLALNDCLNCAIFLVVGLMMGNAVTNVRLSSIQTGKDLKLRENTDFLTNLPNRRKLFGHFESAKNLHGLIMVDIDDFKKYNDTYGHQKGDQVLKALAGCLLDRKDETVEFIRYGGEEFIGVYHGRSQTELEKMCHDLNESVRAMQLPHSSTRRGYITVSIGYYFSDEPIKNETDIYYADAALYRAKSIGKDVAVRYQACMSEIVIPTGHRDV